jgi:hypothetical protein
VDEEYLRDEIVNDDELEGGVMQREEREGHDDEDDSQPDTAGPCGRGALHPDASVHIGHRAIGISSRSM